MDSSDHEVRRWLHDCNDATEGDWRGGEQNNGHRCSPRCMMHMHIMKASWAFIVVEYRADIFEGVKNTILGNYLKGVSF